MKKSVQDYRSTWVTTVSSIIALVFSILVATGVLSPEQSTEAQAHVLTLVGSVGAIITAVTALIAIFKGDPKPKI